MGRNTPGFSSQIKANASTVSQAVKRIIDWLQRFPFASYQILEDIELTTTGKPFAHSLKRVPKGYIVTRKNSSAIVYNEGLTASLITLRSSATTTVNIFLF